MTYKKLLSTILIVSLVLTGIPVKSQAAPKPVEGIFFNASSAKKLLVDLKYCKDNYPVIQGKYVLCEQEINTLKEQKTILIQEKDGLLKDKKILTDIADKHKTDLVQCNKDLTKEIESKPSRMTWFGIGFVSALIVGILSAFAIRK